MQKRLDITPPDKLLSVSSISNPDLPVYRYLFNNTGLLNFNNLVTLKPDVKLKANIYYLYDRQRQGYESHTKIYLPGSDTVTYSEKLSSRTVPNLIHASLNLNINKDKYYLNNTFTADANKQNTFADLNTNGQQVGQRLNDKLHNLSNELSYIGTKGKRTWEFYNFLNYVNQPQSLNISPGINAGYFNFGLPYASLDQGVQIPSFFSNTYLSFRLASLKFRQAYKVGFNTTSENLQSGLTRTLTDGTVQLTSDSAVNNLHWTRSKTFAEGEYGWTGDRLILSVNLPLSYQHISYRDSAYRFSRQLNTVLFNPAANVRLLSGAENYFNFSYHYLNDFGSVADVYRGDILRNYRTLYANDAPLYRSSTHSAGLSFNYRKGIQIFFVTLSAVYSQKTVNTVEQRIVSNNLEQRVIVPLNNGTGNLLTSVNLSKYLFDWHTSLSTKVSWQLSQFNQVLNGSLTGFNNYTTVASLALNSKINERFYLDYSTVYTHYQSAQRSGNIVSGSGQQTSQLRQKGELNLTTVKNLNLKLTGEHYYNRQSFSGTTNYFFADAALQYKLVKHKLELEGDVLNLANLKTFNTTSVSSNTATSSTYDIRGRIAMVKVLD